MKSKCVFCGGFEFRADRALAGKIICVTCGRPLSSRPIKFLNYKNKFSLNKKFILIALIILGPSKLVQFSKSIGNLLKSSRRWIHELQNSIDLNYKEDQNKDEQN